MPRACSICTASNRDSIDAALAAGVAIRRIATEYNVSKDAVARHTEHTSAASGEHLAAAPATPESRQDNEPSAGVTAQSNGVTHRADPVTVVPREAPERPAPERPAPVQIGISAEDAKLGYILVRLTEKFRHRIFWEMHEDHPYQSAVHDIGEVLVTGNRVVKVAQTAKVREALMGTKRDGPVLEDVSRDGIESPRLPDVIDSVAPAGW